MAAVRAGHRSGELTAGELARVPVREDSRTLECDGEFLLLVLCDSGGEDGRVRRRDHGGDNSQGGEDGDSVTERETLSRDGGLLEWWRVRVRENGWSGVARKQLDSRKM